MTTLLARILNEPVVDSLLRDSLGILAATPSSAQDIHANICKLAEGIIQIASELPFQEKRLSNSYWKEAWLRWLNEIEKQPRVIQLMKMYENYFRGPHVTTDNLHDCIRQIVQTVAMVTGLLEAGIDIDLFYT